MIKTDLPVRCEYCNQKLTWEGVNLVCSNPFCSHLDKEHLKAWIMNVAPIPGLGWKTIEKLIVSDKKFDKIETVMDLYVYGVNRFTDVKPNSEKDLFNKMLDKLVKPITFKQFLLGLNIPGLGKIGAENFNSSKYAKFIIEDIINDKTEYYDEAVKILQDKNAVNLMYNDYKDYIKELYGWVDFVDNSNKEIIKTEENKGKVVITGSLSMKRAEFELLLLKHGWTLSNKISKDTKYLITNTPDSGTSKNKEADKLGIIKLTEQQFMEII